MYMYIYIYIYAYIYIQLCSPSDRAQPWTGYTYRTKNRFSCLLRSIPTLYNVTIHSASDHSTIFDYCERFKHGGDLGRTGGRPPKFEVGERPMHPSLPNISRTTVIGCEAKYELTKKRFSGGISGGEISSG